MTDHEPNSFSEESDDDIIAGILRSTRHDADFDDVDVLLDELNADTIRIFTRLSEAGVDLNFDAEQYIEKCKNDLPVSERDAELFEYVSRIVDDIPLEEASGFDKAADKLKKAAIIVTTCSPLLRNALLQALDVLIPTEPQVNQLSDSDIRLLNHSHNGGFIEREQDYSRITSAMKLQLSEEVEQNIRETYGEFANIRRVAEYLVDIGGRLGSAHWERYHTDDVPESVREENFQNALKDINIAKIVQFDRSPIPKEGIDILLIVMKDLMLTYLKRYNGVTEED
jgi:hypothetical protein